MQGGSAGGRGRIGSLIPARTSSLRLPVHLSVGTKRKWDYATCHHCQRKVGFNVGSHYCTLSLTVAASEPTKSSPRSSKKPFLLEEKTPRHYWRDMNRQRALLESIGKQLGITKVSDWVDQKVTRNEIRRRGGNILFHYHNSLENLLKALYPDHSWQPDAFLYQSGRIRRGYWTNTQHLMEFLQKVEEQMGIKQPADWYSVTLADLHEYGLPVSVSKLKLADLLVIKYPDFNFDKVFLLRGRYAQQRRLERAVRFLFPDQDIKINARKETKLINPETGDYFELDVYLPDLKLAFEYQEKHHYITSDASYKPIEEIKRRDAAKKVEAEKQGITLVIVPCWWDETVYSLVASIKKFRPELLTNTKEGNAQPIPEEMPSDFLEKKKWTTPVVEGIGEPVTACFFTLSDIDPKNWWVFEKYDGLRGFWNPETKSFYSRNGNKFAIPQEIVDSMPADIFLDGEIWFGRNNFQEAMKVVGRRDKSTIDWKNFNYMVFDIPNHKGTYSDRYNQLVKYFKEEDGKRKYLSVAPKQECEDINHLERTFQDIVDQGGEGIILRDPQALLRSGRSPGYLKHKKYRDAEARVVGNSGPYQWECELPNGVRFTAPGSTTEFSKRWNPQPGDIVSFKHHGYLLVTKKPKLPTIYRVRTDILWEDVVKNWKEKKIIPYAPPLQKRKLATPQKKKGYWMVQENQRAFIENIGKQLGIQKLEDWYQVSRKDVAAKGGERLLSKYYPSLEAALKGIYPDHPWDSTRFADMRTTARYGPYSRGKNARSFFDEYAKEKGFDPLKADNWYFNLNQLLKKKGGSSIQSNSGGFRRALVAAYPELNFARWAEPDFASS